MANVAKFVGGPLDGEEHPVFGRSMTHLRGRLQHVYHASGQDETRFEWQGPNAACPDCWSAETIAGVDREQLCPECGFVVLQRICHRCASAMEFKSWRGDMPSVVVDGRGSHYVRDDSRGDWTCPRCGNRELRLLRCPICGSDAVAETAGLQFACSADHRFHFAVGLGARARS